MSKKKLKAGYYIDQCDYIAIVYPCGKIEVFTYQGYWDDGGNEGYYFEPREFIGDL